jgi:hypothetical protein
MRLTPAISDSFAGNTFPDTALGFEPGQRYFELLAVKRATPG